MGNIRVVYLCKLTDLTAFLTPFLGFLLRAFGVTAGSGAVVAIIKSMSMSSAILSVVLVVVGDSMVSRGCNKQSESR